jgi:hypothetical protein
MLRDESIPGNPTPKSESKQLLESGVGENRPVEQRVWRPAQTGRAT